jgi:enamine deaminase RidA (YjgF/YER057c/UK114 family)
MKKKNCQVGIDKNGCYDLKWLMPKKQFVCVKAEKGVSLNEQLSDCLSSIEKILKTKGSEFQHILKQTVFLNATGHDDFYKKKEQLIAAFNHFYNAGPPPTAVVGQPPEEKKILSIELLLMENGEKGIDIRRKDLGNSRYTVVNGPDFKEVYASGLTAEEPPGNILERSKTAFEQMKNILENENMNFSHVVRQWNYIENITGAAHLENGLKQNYQVFNDVRGLYYDTSEFIHGYPAATGIGMNYGGVVLEFIAAESTGAITVMPIQNSFQVDAHQYSDSVLVGEAIKDITRKSPPKFERAKLLSKKESNTYFIYISGTAAIRGEKTVGENDVEMQTKVTIENISNLVSPGNLERHGARVCSEAHPPSYFRVYVKKEADLPKVKKICTPFFKEAPGEYLISDICRDDLLVEIEAVVEY